MSTDCKYCGRTGVDSEHVEACESALQDIAKDHTGETDNDGTLHGARWSTLGWILGFHNNPDGGAER